MFETLSAQIQFGLRCYKRFLSPLLPGACRFVPTCSDYAAEAVARHGVFRGGALTLWRLLRCQPLARAGYDPVPSRDALHCGHSDCQAFPRPNADC